MNLDSLAKIIINDLVSMALRIEALQAHPEYTTALLAVKAAKYAMINGREDLHHRSMQERFAKADGGQ